jgi:nicotinamide-nucleotide amidase
MKYRLIIIFIFISTVYICFEKYQIKQQKKLINFLIDNNITISCAESCSGGLLSAYLVNFKNVSRVFTEGIVSYSNDAKIKRLGVQKETLDLFGAVSPEVALEMLNGLNTDIAISITGFASPTNNPNDESGLVYVGLKIKNTSEVIKFKFHGSRQTIRKKSVAATMKLLQEKVYLQYKK